MMDTNSQKNLPDKTPPPNLDRIAFLGPVELEVQRALDNAAYEIAIKAGDWTFWITFFLHLLEIKARQNPFESVLKDLHSEIGHRLETGDWD